MPPAYTGAHLLLGQGDHLLTGNYFGPTASNTDGIHFCCDSGDSVNFVGNIVEENLATVRTGNMIVAGVSGEISYNIIRNNLSGIGRQLYCFQGTTTRIHHNLFENNSNLDPSYPSILLTGPNPHQSFDSNLVVGNGGATIAEYYLFPVTIDARNNWWGDASGPYHPTRNPFGLGDTILSDSVLFDPWLLEPPDTTQSAVERPGVPVRSTWKLLETYPNPFNSQLTIELAGFTGNDFELALFNVLGRRVDTITRGALIGGTLSYSVSPTLSSGIYFLVASDQAVREAKKVVLMK
ncbi:T9SS type A sorting domain-containing protein [bacterium]|nr:T9SS type A sorting domain-containing protein [bacterium]